MYSDKMEEEINECEKIWDQALRRIDAESRVADEVMARWGYEDSCHTREKEVEEIQTKKRRGGADEEKKLERVQRVKKRERKTSEKEMTGEERWRMIVERNQLQERKKTTSEGKRMVKEGKMYTIDRYYK